MFRKLFRGKILDANQNNSKDLKFEFFAPKPQNPKTPKPLLLYH